MGLQCLVSLVFLLCLRNIHCNPSPFTDKKLAQGTSDSLPCHDPNDREDLLLQILKSGLPKQSNPNCKKDIIIVGAGIGGLIAAKLLKDVGHKVTILESSSRVGGRTYTHRNIEEKWLFEMGPMRIPITHVLTRELVKQFGLTLEPFDTSPHSYFVANTRIPYKQYEEGNPLEQPLKSLYSKFNVTNPKEMTSATNIFAEALKEPMKDFKNIAWKDLLKKYDRFSFKNWIAEKAKQSQSSMEMAGVFYNIDQWYNAGLIEMLIDDCVFGGASGFDYIVEGFDRLPRTLFKFLGSNIHFASKVSSVKTFSKNTKVQVNASCSGVNCYKTYNSDYVIFTPTAKIVTSIDFNPPLSIRKQLALRTITYTAATKVALIFKSPFWERENGIGKKGGSTVTDLPIKQIYYPEKSMNKNSKYHVILGSYTWGSDADRYSGMSDKDVINECLRDVAKVHQRTLEFVKLQYHSGIVQRWGIDETTLGGFAMFDPYQYHELEDVLKAREGQILFAGEYTGSPHGWINTALKAGIRAATEAHNLGCPN